MGRNSSVGIATRYGLDGPGIESRGGGARFSAPVQTVRGAHPASCTMGTGSFLGVKRQGRGADHSPPSACRGYERVGLYLYSPSGPQWPVIERTFTFTFKYNYFECMFCCTQETHQSSHCVRCYFNNNIHMCPKSTFFPLRYRSSEV